VNIVVLTLDYPPNRVIGAELAVHRLVKRLQRAGHEVQVRTMAESSVQFEGVRTYAHRTTGLHNPDVVITNAGLATRSRNIWPHTPLVVWAHNNQIGALLDVKEAHPHLVIANTKHMADVLMSVNAQRAMVLYPIPDYNIQRLEARGECVTLINGSREKGGLVVSQVAPLLPDTEFLVVRGGHGPQIAQPAPNVTVIDHQPSLTDVWKATRTLIIPSRLESYSMVGFEAIQRGIPVIGHAIPGVQEALGPKETWVESRDPELWAAVIRTDTDGLRRQHARARHVAERKETIDEQVAELLARLETL